MAKSTQKSGSAASPDKPARGRPPKKSGDYTGSQVAASNDLSGDDYLDTDLNGSDESDIEGLSYTGGLEFLNEGELGAPKARPGFRQRWVRYFAANGKMDKKNINKWERIGYRPRAIESIPAEQLVRESIDKFGDVMMVNGMVLCEIPDARARQKDRIAQEKANRFLPSEKETFLSQTGEDGEFSSKTRTERGGRQAMIADD